VVFSPTSTPQEMGGGGEEEGGEPPHVVGSSCCLPCAKAIAPAHPHRANLSNW